MIGIGAVNCMLKQRRMWVPLSLKVEEMSGGAAPAVLSAQ